MSNQSLLDSSPPAEVPLAPGFRFHPTDEELVSYYLRRRIAGRRLRVDAIAEVDLYRLEPWDLPSLSRIRSRDAQWYFFARLDRKITGAGAGGRGGPGNRTNRATPQGYWKTTGKDREVFHRGKPVGMKKTLVFHNGRAPKGARTNWVMHEYRLLDADGPQDLHVVCRIFQKFGSGPQNGAQYGAPYMEEEWEEDDDAIEKGAIIGASTKVAATSDTADEELNEEEENGDCKTSELAQADEILNLPVVAAPQAQGLNETSDGSCADDAIFLEEILSSTVNVENITGPDGQNATDDNFSAADFSGCLTKDDGYIGQDGTMNWSLPANGEGTDWPLRAYSNQNPVNETLSADEFFDTGNVTYDNAYSGPQQICQSDYQNLNLQADGFVAQNQVDDGMAFYDAPPIWVDGDNDIYLSLDALGSSASQPLPLPLAQSQESSMWEFDEDPPPSPPPRREERRGGKGGRRGGGGWNFAEPAAAPTATLMEAEEYGEMMESLDEVTFALDGLRPTAPRRSHRASLLALLGICDSAERRRMLRAQGLVQQIIDAILVLNIDDPPCAVAAGALLFVLASDVQDNHLLDSETCINFLLKLLNPPVTVVDAKAPSIGSKLLGISKFQMLNGSNKDADSSSEDILSKVEEILLSCKEIKPVNRVDKRTSRPELCSKWLALLTMEKACLSAVGIDETSDTVTKLGGNFKETLRDLGGLDNIFDVIVNCHSELERLVKDTATTAKDLKEGTPLQSATLLLKCLKILENATFLSEDNKAHLLSLSRKVSPRGSPLSFVGVVISNIELLSALSLLLNSTVSSETRTKSCKVGSCSERKDATSLDHNSKNKHSKKRSFLQNQRHKNHTFSKSGRSHISISSSSDVSLPQKTFSSLSISSNSPSNGSFDGRQGNGVGLKLNVRKDRSKDNPIRGSSGWISIRAHTSDENSREMSKRRRLSDSSSCDLIRGGDDPFAFDDVDQQPSNWDLIDPKNKPQRRANGKTSGKCGTAAIGSQESCQPEETHQPVSHSNAEDESNILEDCLLASVKVLMNLANDNPSGCEQIASCGGLNTMASLIIKHFPSFDLYTDNSHQMEERLSSSQDVSSSQNSDMHQVKTKQLRDHELDFLVAILGLLVNLVEKDSLNRVRLASARVSFNSSENSDGEEVQRDVIPLLCSIFLACQGASEAAGAISPDDEESLLRGAREAEMMIVQAYAALLLAFLSTESMKVRGDISSCLPNNNLKVLVPVLEGFVAFHLQLNVMTRETHSAVTELIERCKQS